MIIGTAHDQDSAALSILHAAVADLRALELERRRRMFSDNFETNVPWPGPGQLADIVSMMATRLAAGDAVLVIAGNPS